MKPLGRSTLFREPDGPRTGAIFAALGVFCLGIYGFFRLRYADSSLLMPTLGVINLLMALPEVLPRERTRLAGALRTFNVLFGIVALSYVILQF